MSITPVSLARISHTLRSDLVAETMRRNQVDLFQTQSQIASGRQFVRPSDNPVAAIRVLDLTRAAAQQDQFVVNLNHATNVLSAADSAITEINALLSEAQTITSKNVTSVVSADERAADAELIAGIRQQLQIVGNRQFSGKFIFGGRDTETTPFVDALGGIAYVGDTGERFTRVSEGLSTPLNIPGNLLFGSLSARLAAATDLTPALSEDARIDNVLSPAGDAITTGVLTFAETGGAGTFTVDLTNADTLGHAVTMINDAATNAGAQLTASLSNDGLVITPGGAAVSITDAAGGAIAADLGLLTTTPTTAAIIGETLTAKLTNTTSVDDLAGGAGIDLASGFTITNGTKTVDFDLSTAETVQDIINTINNAGLYVFAEINDDQTGIDVFNQASGTSLYVGENGGTTAHDLGIATFDTATPLSRLNFGRGVIIAEGLDDFQITTGDGSAVAVNIDSAETVGDVIDLINDAAQTAGVSLTASFAEFGNGIRLVDGTGGAGTMSVSRLNLSQAASDLGILTSAETGTTEIVGEDVNPTRTEGILTALVELENALRTDNTQEIAFVGERIDGYIEEVIRYHGIVGARSQATQQKLVQLEDAAASTQIFLSEAQDLDFTAAITELQSAQMQLQASMQTSSVLLNTSLLDFLS